MSGTSRSIHVLLATLAIASTAGAQVQFPGNGHYYEVVAVPGGVPWTQARTQAASMSFMGAQGHLVTVTDSAENDWVYGTLAGGNLDRYWIGLFQDMGDPNYSEPTGGWVWVTGEDTSFTSWFPNEPNDFAGIEHYAAYDHGGPTWNDIDDAWGLNEGYVVEYELSPGTAYCFGDGSGALCPCGNAGGLGEGCGNSGGNGAVLSVSGSASVAGDDLQCDASGLVAFQPALLFVGENAIAGGSGVPFGDGLRCAGSNVVRLGVVAPDAAGAASWGPGLAAIAGWSSGDLRRLQVWYRDPTGSPCGAGFNLSNGVEVGFLP